MDCVRKALVVSAIFALVFVMESAGAPSDGGRVIAEDAPGGDTLQLVMQGLSPLREEMRREWKEALKQLEKKMLEEVAKRNEEMETRLQGLEGRMDSLELRVSAFDHRKSKCAGGLTEIGHLEGRLSRLESCLQGALEGCSSTGTPPAPEHAPAPASSSTPSTAYSSTESPSSPASPSKPSPPPSSAISSYSLPWPLTFASVDASTPFPSTNAAFTPTSDPSSTSSSAPSSNPTALPTSASGPLSTHAPSPWEASGPQPSASAAPPTADPALRKALGEELKKTARDRMLEDLTRLRDARADPNYADKYRTNPLTDAPNRIQAPIVPLLITPARRRADYFRPDRLG